jgi:hypothetical protein
MKREIIVVEPLPEDEAKTKFKEWMSNNEAIVESLGKNDIVVDSIKGAGGHDLFRYRVFVPE